MKTFAITAVAFSAIAWLVFNGTLQTDAMASPDRAFIGAGQALINAVSATASKVSGLLWS